MPSTILVDITHPAHFHFFRPAMEIWREQGIQVVIAARDKDLTVALLHTNGYEYHLLSHQRRGAVGLARELLEHESKLWRLMRRVRPDVVVEIAGTFIVHAAALSGVPSLVFYDTEHARLSNIITYPFATKVITPMCYVGDIGRKHVRYDGYHELAYLHPHYFQPDADVLQEVNLGADDPYFLLRFVSWEASHDIGQHGFSYPDKLNLVHRLRKHGRVLITSEAPLDANLEPFRVRLAAHKIHHLLAFANLYIGEGSTMASEAALLGTPAIYVNSLPLGYISEQQERYGLVHWLKEPEEALAMAEKLAGDAGARGRWQVRRARMLAEKIDVTSFICEQVEPYLT